MSALWDILEEAQKSSRGIVNIVSHSPNVCYKKKRKNKKSIEKSSMK
jgi:hypothetical protein